MKLLVLTVLLVLAGCANTQLERFNQWTQDGLGRAERGELKWSEYYNGCFARLLNVSDVGRDKSADLNMYNVLIEYSLAYEDGKLSRAEFDKLRRQAQLEHLKPKESKYQINGRADSVGDIYPH